MKTANSNPKGSSLGGIPGRPDSETAFRYRDILFFARFAKPVWKIGLLSLILTVVTTALNSLLPLSSKVLIDFVVMKRDLGNIENYLRTLGFENSVTLATHFLQSLELVVLSILLIGLFIGIAGIIKRYLILRFQQELTFNLQTSLFDHLLRFPLPFFKRKQTGYLMSRVSDDVYSIQILFSDSIAQIITTVLYFFFGVAVIFALSKKLTLILLVFFPLYALINYFFGKKLRTSSLHERETAALVSGDLQEILSGVETVKAYTSEKKEIQKISERVKVAMQARIKSSILSLLSQYSVSGVQFAAALVIMWVGITDVMKGSLTIGDYVAFASYMIYLSSSASSLFTFHIMIQPVYASIERLMEIFHLIPEFRHEDAAEIQSKPAVINGLITFDNVSFCYEENSPVISNVSFSAKRGRITALVGPSGAGKTTLINLLFKFFKPESGSISLDGRNINDLPTLWLRDQIGIVSQETFLFDVTIERNIKYGNIDASHEDVIEAAKKSGIHHDAEKLPRKYETVVGERGLRLSAGQRQRISLARVFLKDPPIVIFDEPTSALDPATEKLLKDSLKDFARNKTVLIIAHRHSLLELADNILVISNGRIVESGTYEELSNKDTFRSLFRPPECDNI